ncbi:hypothetical protein [Cardinium endosymbiont of Tipula unca]|uniref:hypothetical protein n=1 Tax=Cardinium endosymbiont of Tipula unca TaxID=3066216 RepID=UPI0030CEBAEC
MHCPLIFSLGKRFVLLIYTLCFLGLSSCKDPKDEHTRSCHPIWFWLNDDEKEIPKDRCIFTKLGWERLRCHVTDLQQCFNGNDFSKPEKNMVEVVGNIPGWVVTPSFYGSVTNEKFPKTMEIGIKHQYGSKEYGLPAQFLEELLAMEDHKEAIVIVSTGMEGQLGVSQELVNRIKKKKEKGEIENYFICRSTIAVATHNTYAKEGKKVFTFICTNS